MNEQDPRAPKDLTTPPLEARSFLGTGWSFPPRFAAGGVFTVSGEEDIRESLTILFSTVPGERLLEPSFGVDLVGLLFDTNSLTMRTLAAERMRTTILRHEPRIRILRLDLIVPDAEAGRLEAHLEYEVRATNSRFNLVHPFYRSDASEVRPAR
jgi:phage baseplate assembly protein W